MLVPGGDAMKANATPTRLAQSAKTAFRQTLLPFTCTSIVADLIMPPNRLSRTEICKIPPEGWDWTLLPVARQPASPGETA
jgi:hypothetical protein